jgi:hypothetical protein
MILKAIRVAMSKVDAAKVLVSSFKEMIREAKDRSQFKIGGMRALGDMYYAGYNDPFNSNGNIPTKFQSKYPQAGPSKLQAQKLKRSEPGLSSDSDAPKTTRSLPHTDYSHNGKKGKAKAEDYAEDYETSTPDDAPSFPDSDEDSDDFFDEIF